MFNDTSLVTKTCSDTKPEISKALLFRNHLEWLSLSPQAHESCLLMTLKHNSDNEPPDETISTALFED